MARGPSVSLLGPLSVTVDGHPVRLPTGKLPVLLAVLAMSAGRPVPVDRLAGYLWGDDPPDNARRVVQTHLARLRGLLGPDLIASNPLGYQLRATADDVDALRFCRLMDAAAAARDRTVERARLGEALALWRGAPFEGLRSDGLHRMEGTALVERYLGAVERCADLDIASGRARELVPRLQELAAAHPLRESLWVRLLNVLGHCGRHAEALEWYERIRVRLADELGVDPGPELRRVYAALLAGRPAVAAPAPEPVPSVQVPVPSVQAPHQLPADIPGFAGRDHALATLTDLLGAADPPRAPAVAVVTGTAGVGKTALAVHWAHQVRDRFPDGQLYVNLRGFDPSGQPMTASEALRLLLDSLGVPPHRIPAELDAQVGLYRTTLTGRRVLVVLDNAREASQVRPLLPGTPGCLAVVTSRDQLAGLIATEAATPVVLDLLTPYEAQDLLTHRLGKDRLAAEPAATDRIIAGCARLPLALAITAARAAVRPTFPLAALADQLDDPGANLATLESGDAATNVRGVFSWSYQALSAAAARLFRLLSLSTGADVAAGAAASLAGEPVPRVRARLAELCRANLLTEHLPGRYTCHDLLRAYATELSGGTDPEPDRQAARQRLVDHYLHTAHAAAVLLYPQREPIPLPTHRPGVHVEPIADHHQALAWFHTEQPALLATLTYTVEAGLDEAAWRLAWSLVEYLDRRGTRRELIEVQSIGLAAARRVDARAAQARAHRDLARAQTHLRDYDAAHRHLERALRLYEQLGDRVGQAHTLLNVGFVRERERRYEEAIDRTLQALRLYLAAGHRLGEARARNSVGWLYAGVGDHRRALRYCRRALALHRELGNRFGEAATLDSIGYAQHHLGEYRQAIASYQHALELAIELGDRHLEAVVRMHRGDARLAAGEPAAARDDWRHALSILEDIDHPDAQQVRERLTDRPGPSRAGQDGGPGGTDQR